MVAERAAAGVADGHVSRALHCLGEGGLGGVREVEDGTALAELIDELAAAIREALRGRVDPGGEAVREVPRQPDDPDAEVPELPERRRISLERLDSLHRQQEPNLAFRADAFEIGARPDLDDRVWVFSLREVQIACLAVMRLT